jgi:hypothetical protein
VRGSFVGLSVGKDRLRNIIRQRYSYHWKSPLLGQPCPPTVAGDYSFEAHWDSEPRVGRDEWLGPWQCSSEH